MIVAVTGTPGTGKTSVARALADLLDYDYLAVNDVAAHQSVETESDEDRGVLAVDVPSLVDRLDDVVDGDTVLDGHLGHWYPADITVVLRCAPRALRDRLADKGWSDEKVRENVEAEAVDIILHQAVDARDNVFEVDTTRRAADEVAEELKSIVEHPDTDRCRPGSVLWAEDAR